MTPEEYLDEYDFPADPRDSVAWFARLSEYWDRQRESPYQHEENMPLELQKALDERLAEHTGKIKEFIESDEFKNAMDEAAIESADNLQQEMPFGKDFARQYQHTSFFRSFTYLNPQFNEVMLEAKRNYGIDDETIGDVINPNLSFTTIDESEAGEKEKYASVFKYTNYEDGFVVDYAKVGDFFVTALLKTYPEELLESIKEKTGYEIAIDRGWPRSFEVRTFPQIMVYGLIDKAAIDEIKKLYQTSYDQATDIQNQKALKPQFTQNLDANQLALLRWMEKAGKGEVSWKELEGLPFGKAATIQEAIKLKNSKKASKKDWEPLTVTDISATPKKAANETMAAVQKDSHYSFLIYPLGFQQLFEDDTNYVYCRTMAEDDFEKIFSKPHSIQEGVEVHPDMSSIMGHTHGSKHPAVNDEVTLAWVRFALLENNQVWVDEIQTDFFDEYVENDWVDESFKAPMSTLLRDTLESFVAAMRAKGYSTIIIPDHRTANELYPGRRAPKYPYDLLPKELRFQHREIGEDLGKDLAFRTKRTDVPYQVWVQASRPSIVDIVEQLANKINNIR